LADPIARTPTQNKTQTARSWFFRPIHPFLLRISRARSGQRLQSKLLGGSGGDSCFSFLLGAGRFGYRGAKVERRARRSGRAACGSFPLTRLDVAVARETLTGTVPWLPSRNRAVPPSPDRNGATQKNVLQGPVPGVRSYQLSRGRRMLPFRTVINWSRASKGPSLASCPANKGKIISQVPQLADSPDCQILPRWKFSRRFLLLGAHLPTVLPPRPRPLAQQSGPRRYSTLGWKESSGAGACLL